MRSVARRGNGGHPLHQTHVVLCTVALRRVLEDRLFRARSLTELRVDSDRIETAPFSFGHPALAIPTLTLVTLLLAWGTTAMLARVPVVRKLVP